MKTRSLAEENKGLEFEVGENSNHTENIVKGVKNSNFLNCDTFPVSGNDCSQIYSASDKCREEQDSGRDCSSSTFDEKYNYDTQVVDDDFECDEKGMVKVTDKSKASVVDVCIAIKDMVEDVLLDAKEKKGVVMCMEDREGEVEYGEGETGKEKIEINGEEAFPIERGEKVHSDKSEFEEENKVHTVYFDRKESVEDVTEKEEDEKEKYVVKENDDKEILSFNDAKVKERNNNLDKKIEIKCIEKDEVEEILILDKDIEEEKTHSSDMNKAVEVEEKKKVQLLTEFFLNAGKRKEIEKLSRVNSNEQVEGKVNFFSNVMEMEDGRKFFLNNENKVEPKSSLDENEVLNEENFISINEGINSRICLGEDKKGGEVYLDSNKDVMNECVRVEADKDLVSLYEIELTKTEKALLSDEEQKKEEMLSVDRNLGAENRNMSLLDEVPKDGGKLSANRNEVVEKENLTHLLLEKELEDKSKVHLGTPMVSGRHVLQYCTPGPQSASQNTPGPQSCSSSASQSTSYCTPAKTVLKYWNPSASRRSSLFAFNTKLNRADFDNTPQNSHLTIEEVEEEDADYLKESLKLEEKLTGSETEIGTASNLNKNFSKLEAYHKTVVAELEEDSQKLEEVMAELSSQQEDINEQKALSQDTADRIINKEEINYQNSLTQDPADRTLNKAEINYEKGLSQDTADGADEEEDNKVMMEFLEGNDGLKVVEDIDFANEQNDTVIEIVDEGVVGNSSVVAVEDVSPCSETNKTLSSREAPDVTRKTSIAVVPFDCKANEKENDRNAEFISDDPLENFDNNDPDWLLRKSISNDKDRYKEIRKRWCSLTIPDPNVNLSYNRRLERMKRMAVTPAPIPDWRALNLSGKKNKKRRQYENRKRKFQESFQCEEGPPAKRAKCTPVTVVYDREIDDLLTKIESKRFKMRSELSRALTEMAARQEREMYECNLYYGDYARLHWRQTEEVRRLTDTYMRQMEQAEREPKDYLALLHHAANEVNTFHAFYEDVDSSVEDGSQFITNIQLEELLETEWMVSSYPQVYNVAI